MSGNMNYQVPRLTPSVKYLLIAYGVVFVISIFIQAIPQNLALFFQESPGANVTLLYRVLTYTFVSSTTDIVGLIFFALFLWWVGGSLEAQWGTRTFVLFLAFTSAVGGILSLLILTAFGIRIPVSGTLGLTFAMIAVFAFLSPESSFYIFGIFPLKAKWLVLISLVLTFLTPKPIYILYALIIQIVSGIAAVGFVIFRFPLPFWFESLLGKISGGSQSKRFINKSGKSSLRIYRRPEEDRDEGRGPKRISPKAKKEIKKLMDTIYKSAKKDVEDK